MTGQWLEVFYPSGQRLRYCARDFQFGGFGTRGQDEAAPLLVLAEPATLDTERLVVGDQVLLDPRCVVVEALTRRVVYDPRALQADLAPWVRDWLRDNDDWPNRLGAQLRWAGDEAQAQDAPIPRAWTLAPGGEAAMVVLPEGLTRSTPLVPADPETDALAAFIGELADGTGGEVSLRDGLQAALDMLRAYHREQDRAWDQLRPLAADYGDFVLAFKLGFDAGWRMARERTPRTRPDGV